MSINNQTSRKMKQSIISNQTVSAVRTVIHQLGGSPKVIFKSPHRLTPSLKISSWLMPIGDINKLKKALLKADLATDVYYTQSIKGTLNTIIVLK